MGFIDLLRQSQAEAVARRADPWKLTLQRVRGKVGDDGIERVTTQILFDILESQRSRAAGACRRLAKLMAELGWTAMRVRGLTRVVIWSRFAATLGIHVASRYLELEGIWLTVSTCKPLPAACLHNHQTTKPSHSRRPS